MFAFCVFVAGTDIHHVSMIGPKALPCIPVLTTALQFFLPRLLFRPSYFGLIRTASAFSLVVRQRPSQRLDNLCDNNHLCGKSRAWGSRKIASWATTSLLETPSSSSQQMDEANDDNNNNRLSLVSLPTEWLDFDQKKDASHSVSDPERFIDALESSSSSEAEADCRSGELDTIIHLEDVDPKDLMVALDLEVVVVPPRSNNTLPSPKKAAETTTQSKDHHHEKTIKIRLNRNADEIAQRVFRRLELSLFKKLAPNNKKKKKKTKRKGEASETTTKTGSSAGDSISKLVVAKRCRDSMVEDATNTLVSSEIIDTEQLNAITLCRELASFSEEESSSIALDVSIPLLENDEIDAIEHGCSNSNEQSTALRPATTTALRFKVDSNRPVILAARTFESFTSKLFVGLPVTVQTTSLHATDVEVSWFVGGGDNSGYKQTEEELVIRNSHFFVPKAHHAGKSLTVVLRPVLRGGGGGNNSGSSSNKKRYGRAEAYQFHNAIEELPPMPVVSPLRDEFVEAGKKPSNGENNDDSSEDEASLLRVCTYNILADLYVSHSRGRTTTGDGGGETTTPYPHVEYEHVEKTRRIPMIVAELRAYRADVVCLQEVDGSVFDAYLQPTLWAMGYDGYYSNKASQQREGCAIFWSTKALERDRALSFDVKDLFAAPSSHGDGNGDLFEREWKSMQAIRQQLLEPHKELNLVATEKLGQVLQIARLTLKHPKSDQPNAVVVANTHLFWHPMADHIRVMQAFAVAKKIDEVCRRYCDNDSSPDPFLLCGDLNSDPLSGACQLLTTRSLEPNHKDCWNYLHTYKWDVEDDDVDEMVDSGTTAEARRRATANHRCIGNDGLTTPPIIALPDSFPPLVSGCQPTPSFTNFALRFSETLDYVFASRPSQTYRFGFVPHRSASMPSVQDIKAHISMPNEFMPSDHVSIVCDLQWCRWEEDSSLVKDPSNEQR